MMDAITRGLRNMATIERLQHVAASLSGMCAKILTCHGTAAQLAEKIITCQVAIEEVKQLCVDDGK
jgi:hypothetical protein